MKLSKYEFNEKYKRDAKIVVIVPSQGQLISTDVDQKIEDELRTIGGQLTVVDAGEVYTASLFHYVDIFVKSDFFRSILEGAAYDVLKTSLTALAKSIFHSKPKVMAHSTDGVRIIDAGVQISFETTKGPIIIRMNSAPTPEEMGQYLKFILNELPDESQKSEKELIYRVISKDSSNDYIVQTEKQFINELISDHQHSHGDDSNRD